MLSPQSRLSRRRNGFSVVELMVTLTVLSILVAMGAPALRTFVENGRIRAAGESMKYGLTLARAEAVRLNAPVEFVRSDAGWQVRRVADATVLHLASGKEGANGLDLEITPEDSDRVTFDAFGRVVASSSDGSEPIAQVDIASAKPPSTTGYQPLRLQLLAGGMTRLCSPLAVDGDPRACL